MFMLINRPPQALIFHPALCIMGMSKTIKYDVIPLALVLLLLAPVFGQVDPTIIKVLAMGKGHEITVLRPWFTSEPSTSPTLIPMRGDQWSGVSDVQRYMRIYFPRTYDQLTSYEYFTLAQTDLNFLSDRQERWLYRTLSEKQMGAFNTRSVLSALSSYHDPWRNSILSEAFPNDVEAVLSDMSKFQGERGQLIIKRDPDLPSIMGPFKEGIEPLFPNYNGLNTVPKPGSKILSYTRNNQGVGSPIPGQIPHVFYWKWNESVTFTFRDMVTNRFWSTENPYARDVLANIVWFSTGRDLPEDPMKVHKFRQELYEFDIQQGLLLSLLEFAESFGANPSDEYEELGKIRSLRTETTMSYLDRDFDAAYESLDQVIGTLMELQDRATELKNEALLYVYLVEWLAIMGVSLAAGFLLWTIMIRRALYRQVKTTRRTS